MRLLIFPVASALLLAPILVASQIIPPFFASAAYADDDDDDGGAGNSGGTGGSRSDRTSEPRAPAAGGWSLFPRLFGPPRRALRAQRPAAPVRTSVPNEIVVVDVGGATLDQLASDGFTILARTSLSTFQGEIARLTAPQGMDFEAARAAILAVAPAAIIDQNHLYRPVEMPCERDNCPAFEMIGWAVPPASCGLAVTIGMIDTVVNKEHEALRDQAVEVISVMAEGDRESSAVHGTAIAALLVGNEESRTPGLLPNASLIAVEAFHRDGANDAADVFKIVRGLDELGARGVRVVNMSFAGPANAVLERVVEQAAGTRMILVSAAGNAGPRAPAAYPGAYPEVIAVTAIDRAQRVYRQAGRGDHIAFSAPGVRIWTAASVSGGRFRSGTSYAVPFVTASVAGTFASGSNQTPDETLAALTAGVIDLGDTGRDPIFGWGLVTGPQC